MRNLKRLFSGSFALAIVFSALSACAIADAELGSDATTSINDQHVNGVLDDGTAVEESAVILKKIDFCNTDMGRVLRWIAREGNIDLIVDDSITKKITVHLYDTEALRAINDICHANGLIVEEYAGMLRVSEEAVPEEAKHPLIMQMLRHDVSVSTVNLQTLPRNTTAVRCYGLTDNELKLLAKYEALESIDLRDSRKVTLVGLGHLATLPKLASLILGLRTTMSQGDGAGYGEVDDGYGIYVTDADALHDTLTTFPALKSILLIPLLSSPSEAIPAYYLYIDPGMIPDIYRLHVSSYSLSDDEWKSFRSLVVLLEADNVRVWDIFD